MIEIEDMNELMSEPSVEKWIAATQHIGESTDEVNARLGLLADFFTHIDKRPDELVAYCFLRKKDTGERFVSTQRRKDVNEQIELFVASQGWSSKLEVVNGNRIRSFLTHNGIPMGNRVWTGG